MTESQQQSQEKKDQTHKTSLLLSHFSRVQLCATPQTAAHQAPPSLGFSRQEHWSGLPFPSPMLLVNNSGLPRWLSGKNLPASAGDAGDSGSILVGKIPWRRKWQPTPVFLPGESRGQRILAGYSPWGYKELDMTEQLTHTYIHIHRVLKIKKESLCITFVWIKLYTMSRRMCIISLLP